MSESETIENHEQVLESDGSFERDFSELEKCGICLLQERGEGKLGLSRALVGGVSFSLIVS